MKKPTILLGILIVNMLVIPNTQAAYCIKSIYNYIGVNGDWEPWNNTNNYKYQTNNPGPDIFLHKNGMDFVSVECSSGSYKIDYFPDGRDACRVPATQTTNVISTQSAIGVTGRWKPWHNTNKFFYQINKPHRDIFQHKTKPARSVKTKCSGGRSYKTDHFSDGRDACLTTVHSCPSDYTLVH